MWRKLGLVSARMLVLSFFCFLHMDCSQIMSVAAPPSHNHHHQFHPSDASSDIAPSYGDSTRQRDRAHIEQELCDFMRCEPGRECIVNLETGQAQCGCVRSCEEERKSNKPVCGTDGRVYPSYCDLEKTVCLTGTHIVFSHYHHHKVHHGEVGNNNRKRNGRDFGRDSNNISFYEKNQQDFDCFTDHHHHHHHGHHHHHPGKNPLAKERSQQPLHISNSLHHSKKDEIQWDDYHADAGTRNAGDEDYGNSQSKKESSWTRTRNNRKYENGYDANNDSEDDNEYIDRDNDEKTRVDLHRPTSHTHDFRKDGYQDHHTEEESKRRKILYETTNDHTEPHPALLSPSSHSGFIDNKNVGNGRNELSNDSDKPEKTGFGLGKQSEMAEQVLFANENLEPLAPLTNPEWTLQEQEKEIRSSQNVNQAWGKTPGESSQENDHWGNPVKKSSSVGTGDEDVGKSSRSFRTKLSFREPTSASRSSTGFSKQVCTQQNYEMLKAEIFQYNMSSLMKHIELMTTFTNDAVAEDGNDGRRDGNDGVATGAGRYPRSVGRNYGKDPWSDVMATAATSTEPLPWLNMEGDGPEADKDNLLGHIFAVLDRNHDNILEYPELYKGETENTLELYSPEKTGCQIRDFLLFDDTDHDGQLHVNEFFASFSHFYDITMISLDKALESKHVWVVEGENLVLRCDITGSPPPYIQWKRYGTRLTQMVGHGLKSNIDGSLSLTNIHMLLAGHYSCQSPRNPEVVQTHIVHVETHPSVVISPKVSQKRPGEDLLLICKLIQPVIDLSSNESPGTGHSINWTWLFNGIPLHKVANSESTPKYIFDNSSDTARLRLREIYFQDMGSYSCQAENAAGTGTATASLVVIDPAYKPEVQAFHRPNSHQLLVFHRNGLASYSTENCGWLWEIFGDDGIQNVARSVCDQFNSECDWGRAVQVSPNLVFVAEPSQGGVLVIDVGAVQSVGNAVGVIETCKNITQLEYVPYTDQVWMRCEVGQRNSFIVIENASRGGGEYKGIQFPYAVLNGPLPVKISQVYLPSHSDGNRAQKDCQFGYARSLPDEQALRRMELKRLTYQQSSYLNLTKFACIPNQVFFSLSCTFSIINCLDPLTKSPNGQLVVDTLTNAVRYKNSEISGISTASPDNRILLTEKHVGNSTHLFVQRIGAIEITLLSHFLLHEHYESREIVHSIITGAYASLAHTQSEKEAVISLETGEVYTVDDLFDEVPHSSQPSGLYPADGAFPLKTDKSVIVMDGETLRPRCKFYEEIPELQSFLAVKA